MLWPVELSTTLQGQLPSSYPDHTTGMRLRVDVCPDSIQVERPGDTEYNGYGFRSQPSITGRFSHSFTTPGTYYYIAEGYGHIGMDRGGYGYIDTYHGGHGYLIRDTGTL